MRRRRRGTRRAWSLAAGLVAVNAACGPAFRPVPDFDPGEVQQPVPLEGTPHTLLWRSRPTRGPSAPVAHDDTIAFLGGSDRKVVALDLASGRKRWSHRLGGPLLGGALFDGQMVYAATSRPDGKVRSFDPASGNKRWEVQTGYVEAPLALVGETIIALTQNDEVFGIARKTGEVHWRIRLPSHTVGPVPVGGEEVLVTSYDTLYRVRVRDGRVRLRRKAPGVVVGAWVVHPGGFIAALGDSALIALDPDSLAVRWRVGLDAPPVGPPDVAGDTVYAQTQVGSLYRAVLSNAGGAERLGDGSWPPTTGPVRFGDVVVLGGSDGVLRAVRAQDGAAAWQVAIGRPVPVPPVRLGDGSLLVIGGRGDVQRVR